MQERRNSIANALELLLSCTNPSRYLAHDMSYRDFNSKMKWSQINTIESMFPFQIVFLSIVLYAPALAFNAGMFIDFCGGCNCDILRVIYNGPFPPISYLLLLCWRVLNPIRNCTLHDFKVLPRCIVLRTWILTICQQQIITWNVLCYPVDWGNEKQILLILFTHLEPFY